MAVGAHQLALGHLFDDAFSRSPPRRGADVEQAGGSRQVVELHHHRVVGALAVGAGLGLEPPQPLLEGVHLLFPLRGLCGTLYRVPSRGRAGSIAALLARAPSAVRSEPL